MGIFDIFRKKTPEQKFREKVRDAFEESVRDAKKQLMNNPMFDGLLIEAAIGNTRKALLEVPELQVLGLMANGWIPEEVIDQECNRCLNKYLKR